MEAWIQYHNPTKMTYGIEHCSGPPFSIYSSVADGNPIGNRVWLVGRLTDQSSEVYIGYWFIVDEVRPCPNPNFLYEYCGCVGADLDPMPLISQEDWFSSLLRKTRNFHNGFSKITDEQILDGLYLLS